MVNEPVAFLCVSGWVLDGWRYQPLPGFSTAERPLWVGLAASSWRLRLTDGERTLGYAPLGLQPFSGCEPGGSARDGLALGVVRADDRIRRIEVVGEAGVVHQHEVRPERPDLEDVRVSVEGDAVVVRWSVRSAGEIWAQARLEPAAHAIAAAPIPSPIHWTGSDHVSLPLTALTAGREVRVRVWVSDGLASTSALSGPLLLPPMRESLALVVAPKGEVAFGRSVLLRAHRCNPEDPRLPDDVRWVIDGMVRDEREANLTLRDLCPGVHRAELRTETEVLACCAFTVAEVTEAQTIAADAWRRYDARRGRRRSGDPRDEPP